MGWVCVSSPCRLQQRIDLAYNAFFQGLRKLPKFKPIRTYSGWTYPATSGWKANTSGQHGNVNLNDLGIKVECVVKPNNGKAYHAYHRVPGLQWFASFTVEVPTLRQSLLTVRFGIWLNHCFWFGNWDSTHNLRRRKVWEHYQSTFYSKEAKINIASKNLRRKQAPNRNKRIKASRRWRKANAALQNCSKVGTQRRDWQHKVTSDITSRYDIGVTGRIRKGWLEKLNTAASERSKSRTQ